MSSVTPNSGGFIGGTPLTIKGVNFVTAAGTPNTVTIGGRACTNIVTVDETTLTCASPAGTPGLAVDVIVTNDEGTGRLAKGFRYLTPAPVTSDLNGDGVADLIIGAPLDDVGGTNAGAVFVFFGAQGRATLHDRVSADADVKLYGIRPNDNFGSSVCAGDLNGDDVDDLIVGANLADGATATDAGTVFVFNGPLTAGTTISASTASTKIIGETAVPGDRFGTTVELGDITGDASRDLLVSATLHDRGGAGAASVAEAGCVYVFDGGAGLANGGAQQASYTFDGVNTDDRIGSAITSGDLSGDDVDDLVIGCPMADAQPSALPTVVDAGAACVMLGGTAMQSTVVSTAVAIVSGESAGDQFGTKTCTADVNGDGLQDLVVSAWLNDRFDPDAGRVYVFFGGAPVIRTQATEADVVLSGHATHNSFGKTVVVGDVNGDAIADVLVGAPQADFMSDNSGRVYMFAGKPGMSDTIASQADLVITGENFVNYGLGTAVGLLDLDGDGLTDVAAASTHHNSGAGKVFVLLGVPASGVIGAAHADLKFTGSVQDTLFGASISMGQ